MIGEELIIRKYTQDDQNFIINSWTESHFSHSLTNKFVPEKIYFKNHSPLIKTILEHPKTITYVAANREQQDLIYGYACYSDNMAHYIYVKRPFNGFGIARKLIESQINKVKYCSHLTPRGIKLLNELNLIYNPYLLGEYK